MGRVYAILNRPPASGRSSHCPARPRAVRPLHWPANIAGLSGPPETQLDRHRAEILPASPPCPISSALDRAAAAIWLVGPRRHEGVATNRGPARLGPRARLSSRQYSQAARPNPIATSLCPRFEASSRRDEGMLRGPARSLCPTDDRLSFRGLQNAPPLR